MRSLPDAVRPPGTARALRWVCSFCAHSLRLASGRIPTPSGAPPEHFRRCRLRPPASDCEPRPQPRRAEILRRTLRKSSSVGCSSAHLFGLGVATSLSGRRRQMGTKGKNMNLSRVEIIGFLGSEPETTYTPNGKAVAALSLATKTSWTNGDERQERTEWHRIQAWAKLGENMLRVSKKKGSHLRVEGEFRSREYQTDSRRQSSHVCNRRLFDHQPASRSADLRYRSPNPTRSTRRPMRSGDIPIRGRLESRPPPFPVTAS